MIQIDTKKSAETTLDGEYSTVMAELTSAIRDIRKKYPEETSDEDFELSKMDSKELAVEAINTIIETSLLKFLVDIVGEENE